MAIVYRYANDTPPAPFVLVNLSSTEDEGTVADIPAKVDTGADCTVIPNLLVARLGLTAVGRLVCAGLAGQESELSLYQVNLQIRGLSPIVARVAASDGEPYILLGRDVLNRYRIVLDGPNGKLEIG